MRVDGHMTVPDDLAPGDQTANAEANAADRDLATGRRTCITTYCRASTKCWTDCTWTLNAAAGTVVRRNASCRSQVVLTVIGSWRRIDSYVELGLSSIIIVASESTGNYTENSAGFICQEGYGGLAWQNR